MAKKKQEVNVGHYAFLAGIAIAILAGLGVSYLESAVVTSLLALLGLIVGLMNITSKEQNTFLIACIGILVAAIPNYTVIPAIGTQIDAVFGFVVDFVAPAAFVIGIKLIWLLAEDK